MIRDADALINAYIDDALDDAQFESLCHWLREASEHREIFARKLAMHSAIAEWCNERADGPHTDEATTAEAEAAFALAVGRIDQLTRHALEESAAPCEALASRNSPSTNRVTGDDAFSFRRFCTQAASTSMHYLRTKPGISITAATVLMAGALFTLWLADRGAGPGADTPVAEEALEPKLDSPTRVVATLTAEMDADWDRHPGRELHAGERFTLIQGIAKITTVRGAIATLEAPATIELLDNVNALRLHTGKLVGKCETPSSQGFVVRTPHMDLTDLGTRFGVACDASNQTFVEVFEGKVQVKSELGGALAAPVTLKASETITLDASGQSVATDPIDRPAFTAPVDGQAGVIAASPNVRIIDARPPAMNALERADEPRANVYIERRRVVLPGDVTVHATRPGRYDAFSSRSIQSSAVPAGTAVRSYIVQVVGVRDPSTIDAKHIVVTGQVTFDTPVVGVIASVEQWADFNRTVPGTSALPEGVQPGKPSPLLEGADMQGRGPSNDRLTLEPDGRTLTFRCFMAKQGVDQFRVLVAATATEFEQQDFEQQD